MPLGQTSGADWRSYPEWKRDLAQPIHKAVYNAAVGMTDEEVEAVVRRALDVARRHLSS